MRIKILIGMLLLGCFNMGTAQELLPEIGEEVVGMSQGKQPALTVFMDNATPKIAAQTWKDIMRSYQGKTKNNFLKKEYQSKVIIPEISEEFMEVYAQFQNSPDSQAVTAVFWFQLDNGKFMNADDHSDKFAGLVDFVTQYYQKAHVGIAEYELSQQEKLLKTYQKEMDQLRKNRETYDKKIEDAKALIALMEKNIEHNTEAQTKTEKNIEEQKIMVEIAKGNVEKLAGGK